MASGTLYGPSDSFRTQRVLVAAKYGQSDVSLDKSYKTGVTDQSEDFQAKFPLGKVPAFEGKDGLKLVGASAISAHVGKKFAGTDDASRALVNQWVDLADNEFLPAALGWVLPSLSLMENNKQHVDHSRAELLRLLGLLNKYLLTRTYLVGERVTLADVTLAADLLLAYQHVLEPSVRGEFGNVTRWFRTIVNQPNFKSVTGEVSLCEKAAQFDGKKFAQFKPQGAKGDAGGKKDKKPQTEQPKQEKKKKEEPKKEPKEEMDAAEEALAAEPKKKDPFEIFPKTSFNFDEFKKVYSNEDTIEKAIPWFWEHYDKENLSIWYCEYKYPEELTLTFMSCNLMGGMMQRLDKMRKHSFGSMILFGENNNSTISGVWFWRGDKLAFELSDDLQIDYGSYDWKKLDPEADKALINEYFAWEGNFGGKKFNQGKIFK